MESRPDNREVVERVRRERAKLVRLTEMRLEGEFDREEYRRRKREVEAGIEDLEARLGSPGYDPEAALRGICDVGEVIRRGDPVQQRRAVRSVFERIEVSVETGQVASVVPRAWFGLFFRDLTELLNGGRAWRGPGARSVRRLAGLIA